MHYTLHSIIIQYIYTLYSVYECVLFTVHGTVYTVQCILYWDKVSVRNVYENNVKDRE